MPASGQFGSAPARQSFALERRGETKRGSTVSLPTALTFGKPSGGSVGTSRGATAKPATARVTSGGGGGSSSSAPKSASSSGGSGGSGSSLSDAGYTSGNPDVSARTVLERPVTPQRQAARLRGLSAVRSAVRRVGQQRPAGASAARQPAPRSPGSR